MPSIRALWVLLPVALLLVPVFFWWRHLMRQRRATGQTSPWFWVASGLGVALTVVGALAVQFL
jgi:hypothetical protein